MVCRNIIVYQPSPADYRITFVINLNIHSLYITVTAIVAGVAGIADIDAPAVNTDTADTAGVNRTIAFITIVTVQAKLRKTFPTAVAVCTVGYTVGTSATCIAKIVRCIVIPITCITVRTVVLF